LGGSHGGRDGGRGRGRGEYYDWREHPEHLAKVNPALEDTASSPSKVKDVTMEEVERNAKK
jgi:hypothetical protein